MRDMAHSICLLKLYQLTMRQKISIFVSDYLNLAAVKIGFASRSEFDVFAFFM